ncbi:helix-turn-helix transcriptional regulator [Sphingomonas jejuensis]|uniref:helix-turn-helix transcriptional regulator n=1 Tax=Sphingomonas jejuensis TaxID=904715 RepID=UPI00143B9447|nr:AlpA family phage regulatory protein [Sphingomonas jejuensis]
MTNPVDRPTANACRHSLDLPRTIRRAELRAIVPLADSTIYEMERRGAFPRRFALSPRCVVWDLAEVKAWLTQRRQEQGASLATVQHPDVHLRRTRPVRR